MMAKMMLRHGDGEKALKLLEECRAVDLLKDESGNEVTSALLLDIKQGRFIVAEASSTLVATGGENTAPKRVSKLPTGSEKSVTLTWQRNDHMFDL